MSTIRFHNNTSYKTIPAQDLLDDCYAYLLAVNRDKIESIELTDDKITVMGTDELLLEHSTKKPLKMSGVIRWFDKSSGEGMIRLSSGNSVWFFACNVVGADSQYPQLTTNIQFNDGDAITCEISADPHTARALGACNIRMAA